MSHDPRIINTYELVNKINDQKISTKITSRTPTYSWPSADI